MKQALLAALVGVLATLWFNKADARWYPSQLPTEEEIADTIIHIVSNFEETGVWYWRVPELRARYYDRGRLLAYAQHEYRVLQDLDVCPVDRSMDRKCFDALVTLNEEFFRQTKFRPDAHSRYNRASDEMCQDPKFRAKWSAQCKKRGARWVTTRVPFEFEDPWCDKIRAQYGYLTDAFRRRCKASRMQRADMGMGQQHMSTLNHIGHSLFGDDWHYTMVRSPAIAIQVTATWILGQSDRQACGQWLQRLTRGKTRAILRSESGITYSCLLTRQCGGMPMRVGNPKSCCRYLRDTRKAFQAVMGDGPDA